MQRPNIIVICISLTLLCLVFSCTKDPVDYSKDINDLKALVTELQHRSDSLATALGNTNTNLSNLSKSVDSIKLKLTDIQTQIDALSLSLTTANANIAAINAQLILLNQQYASLLAQLNAILALLNAAPPTLADGLVAYYPFSGNAGDSSGNGNHGTVNGAILSTDRFGNTNKAYYFDGVNDWIEIANSQSVTLLGDLSISAWVNTKGTNGQNYQTVVSKRETYWTWEYALGLSYHEGIIHNTKVITSRATGMGSQEQAWSTTSYNINTWEHWIAVYNLGQVKIYKNGTLDYSGSFSKIPNQQNCPLLIGRNTLVDTTENFYGSIDEVRIYNRALNQSEITYLASH